ncbi:FAD binding domain-containing protein [Chloroflexota bacterium]
MQALKLFEYLEPKTVDEAVQILSKHGAKAKALAGGTDLVVSLRKRLLNPQYMVYIKSIPGLDYIQYNQGDGLRIGAMATHESIAESPIIRENFGLLATACGEVGTPQIRSMGTIGGNICMAGPSQDTPPALLALDARLKLVGHGGERTVPIDEFFIAPFETILGQAEILTEIHIPSLPTASAGYYQWITKMSSVDETLVGVAVVMTAGSVDGICKDIKIGLCSVAPTPIRARRAEELLRGNKIEDKLVEQVAQVAADETTPRSRADYRRKMTGILVKRAINETWRNIR